MSEQENEIRQPDLRSALSASTTVDLLYVGDVPWQTIPPPAPWQAPQFVPTNTFPTEQSLREFVKRCVHEALDELAREMRENKAFKPNPFYVETPGSEHAV